MSTSKDNLIQRITELEGDLKEAREYNIKKNQVTYIHETSHLYCSDGEMHIQYGDCENENWVVYNTDHLFKDLPFIINQVVKENKKMQDYYLDNIKKELIDMSDLDVLRHQLNNPKEL